MKLQDKETLSVAQAVRDVLEGKKPAELSEAVVVTEMDPKKHVKEKDGKFCVYNTNGDIVKEFNDEAAAVKYATDNHDDLMAESPDEPTSKGEKEFKSKHTLNTKKSGANTDGTVVKEETKADEEVADPLPEITPPGTAADTALVEGFSPAEIKKGEAIAKSMGGNMTGAMKKIELIKKGLSKDKKVYAAIRLANEEAHVEEDVATEESEKQAKYKAFFTKALKKFGVTSPAELKGDDKKKFFDYVDKNYESDNEEDAEEEVKEAFKELELNWDMDDPREYQGDMQDVGVYLDKWDKRRSTIIVSGDEKDLLKWLVSDYGFDKKEAQAEVRKAKKVKESVDVQEATITVNLSERKAVVDVDWMGDKNATQNIAKKFKVKIKVNDRAGTAEITGDHKFIISLLTDPDVYGWDKKDVIDVFPELK